VISALYRWDIKRSFYLIRETVWDIINGIIKKKSALVYLDDLQAKIVTRTEKGAEFRGDSYNNGYRDSNNYLEKSLTYYYYYNKGKRRDRFLDF